MISFEELHVMKFKDILELNKSHKLKIIEIIINKIADDDVRGAVECFETEKEQKEYLKWLGLEYTHKDCTK